MLGFRFLIFKTKMVLCLKFIHLLFFFLPNAHLEGVMDWVVFFFLTRVFVISFIFFLGVWPVVNKTVSGVASIITFKMFGKGKSQNIESVFKHVHRFAI